MMIEGIKHIPNPIKAHFLDFSSKPFPSITSPFFFFQAVKVRTNKQEPSLPYLALKIKLKPWLVTNPGGWYT